MKKIVASILTVALLLSCFGMVAQAKVGDVKGSALHTDIVAYINHYAIPSYAVNGQSVIVAEDLRNFGFDVAWNQYDRSLVITRNRNTAVNSMSVKKDGATGSKFTDILETDIKVYAGGQLITSYAMNGYTMIPMEELTMFGQVNWVQGERALKMWVDGLHARSTKQSVTAYSADTSQNSGFSKLKSFVMSKGGKSSSGSYVFGRKNEDGSSVSVHYDPIENDGAILYVSPSGASGLMFNVSATEVPSVSIISNEMVVYVGEYYSSKITTIVDYVNDSALTNEFINSAYQLFDLYFTSQYSDMRMSDFGISY